MQEYRKMRIARRKKGVETTPSPLQTSGDTEESLHGSTGFRRKERAARADYNSKWKNFHPTTVAVLAQ